MVQGKEFEKVNRGSEMVTRSGSTASASSEFKFRRTFHASRGDVWNAFTKPEHLKQWWGTPGSSIEVISHELKPGGMFHYRMKFADGRAIWGRFIFRDIVAPECLVWLNSFSDEGGGLTSNPWVPASPRQTINTVTFADHGDTTELRIIVAPYEASDEEIGVFSRGISGMKMGFGATFQILADYLARQS